MKKLILRAMCFIALVSCNQKPKSVEQLLKRNLNATGGIHQWKSVKSWTQKHHFSTLLKDRVVVVNDQIIETELPFNKKLTSFSDGKIATVDLTNSDSNRQLYQYSSGKPTAAMNLAVEIPYANEELKILNNMNNWELSEIIRDKTAYYSIQNDSLKVQHLYDTKSYLKVMSIVQTLYGESIITYSKYEWAGNFIIPYLKEEEVKASRYKRITKIKEVTFDVTFDPEIFQSDDSWRKIALGKTIPAAPKSLVGGDLKIYQTSMNNELVLIDFWATWCKPCVKEFPNLKALYSQYKDRGFEILAISLDQSKTTTDGFIEKRNIEWPNVTFEDSFNSDMAKLFEVAAIPRAVLVDSTGKIVAIDESAKGEQLKDFLKARFEKVKK